MSKFSRGSRWRKWDLHFHTPSSYDYKDMSISEQAIIEKLVENEIEVIAVTDHHKIDIDRITNLQRISNNRVTVLPGIEFKSELGGSEPIHFIGIFPEDSDLKSIWIKIQAACKLTPEDLAKKKDEEISCHFIPTSDLIHELGGLVSIHAGSKTNTIENITNTLSHKMATKRDLVGYIDIYELGSSKDIEGYEEKVFPNIDRILPMIICSDNHDIKQYILKENLWIKADPTFEGLKQIIHEPNQRVFIGDIPPKLEFVRGNEELFIDSLEINTTSNDDEWFDSVERIKLNNGLVAIIGNKGNGKSALADIIGMTGNANTDQFSFLNSGKFLGHPCSTKYKCLLKFRDKLEYQKEFSKPIHIKTTPSKVVYLSQSFVKELCEDLEASRLQNEIDRVIFSHIPVEEQLGKNNLEELLILKNKSFNDQLLKEKGKLNSLNVEIEALEKQLKKDHIDKISNKLAEKEKSHKLLVETIVKPVAKPDKKLAASVTEKITKLKELIKIAEKDIKKKQTDLNSLVQERQEFENVSEKVKILKKSYDELTDELNNNDVLKKYSISSSKLINLVVDLKEINTAMSNLKASIKKLKDENAELKKQVDKNDEELKEINKGLNEQQKTYQLYTETLEKIEKKKSDIMGDTNVKDTILFYRSILADIKNKYPLKLKSLYDKRNDVAKSILDLIFQKKNLLPSLYEFARKYAENQADHFKVDQSNFIAFDSKTKFKNGFEESFLDYINKGRKGSYYGKEESLSRLRDLMKTTDTDSIQSLLEFPGKILHSLNYNLADNPDGSIENDIDSQLLVSTRTEFYDKLFSFNFLEANFEITFGGMRIQNLSPGERGTLLLIFYLLIDKDKRPIIIDQPEENLDNETVYQKLVPFLRSAKNERQVILVTHNPNLAIVCDSEQIIYSKIDKQKKNLVKYLSGSIEFSQIRDKALDILEGTEPAFMNRKNKYNIQ